MPAISTPIIKVQGTTLELPKKYNATNYFICSMGVFQKVDELPAGAIFIHQSEDSTYYTSPCKKFLYRVSNHWALQECDFVGSCFWVMKGCNDNDYQTKRIGVIKFSALKNIPTKLDLYVNFVGKVRIANTGENISLCVSALKLYTQRTRKIQLKGKKYALIIKRKSIYSFLNEFNCCMIFVSDNLENCQNLQQNKKKKVAKYHGSTKIERVKKMRKNSKALILSCHALKTKQLISKLLGL